MWLTIILIIIVFVLIFYGFHRSQNESYTWGKGLFKNSEDNLDKDLNKSDDASDYEYFNNKNKLK